MKNELYKLFTLRYPRRHFELNKRCILCDGHNIVGWRIDSFDKPIYDCWNEDFGKDGTLYMRDTYRGRTAHNQTFEDICKRFDLKRGEE